MKKAIVLAASFFALICIVSSCKKDDKTVLTGRDAVTGSYNFTNTYTSITRHSPSGFDTLQQTETYIISIDKPEPDNMGANTLVISNLVRWQPTAPVFVDLNSDGTVLNLNSDSVTIEFYNFQGVKTGNTISFDYKAYGRSTGDIETGHGDAVKR